MNGFNRIKEDYLTDDEIEMYARHYYDLLPYRNEDGEKYHQSRRIAAGDILQEEYNYITRPVTKEIELEGQIHQVELRPPAEIKNIPIVEPGIRVLVSDVQNRPINFDVNCVSEDVIEQKESMVINDFNKAIEIGLRQKLAAFNQQQQLLAMQQQALQEQQDPQLVQQINEYINEVNNILNRETALTNKELEELEVYFTKTFKDLKELDVEHILKHHIDSCNLNIKFARGFREMLTCGLEAEIYRISVNQNEEKIDYDIVYAENLVYPHVDDLMFLEELPYLKEVFYMSRVDAEMFFENIGVDNPVDMYHHKDENAVFVDKDGQFVEFNTHQYGNNDLKNENIAIEKIMFKVNRRSNGKIIQDLYEAYFFEEEYKIGMLHQYPLRDPEDLSKVQMPYAGWCKQPKYNYDSLVWKTRDIQELVNILHYKKTLLIVTSGVQGMIYDLSQKPESMELNELMYYLSNGIGFIETLDGDGRPKNNAYNQFGKYDQSLSGSIQAIDYSIQMLKDLAAELTGINAIRQGTLRPNDQVGSVQLAYNQSSVATEFYFANHEAIVEKALSYAANLGNYIYNKGKVFTYRDRNVVQRIRLPKNRYDSNSIIYVKSGVKANKNLEMIKQAMQMRMAQAPMLDELTAFTEIIEAESVNTARNILLNYAELAEQKVRAQQEQGQAMQQQMMQQQQQVEQQLAQFNAQQQQQLEMIKGQVQQQIQQLRSQTEIQKAQMSMQEEQIKSQTALQVQQMKSQSDKYSDDMETGVEAAYLEKEYRQLDMEARLQTISMFIDQNKKAEKIDIRSKERVKD